MSKIPEVAQRIATALQEPNVRLVALVVEHVGEEAAVKFLQQTLEVEAQGGMMVESEQRRRTPGGVFFHLVKQSVPLKERRKWWPWPKPQHKKPPHQEVKPATLEECVRAATEAMQTAGEATTVKITLVGQPGRVVERGDTVLVAMESSKAPMLSKGLPELPAEPTSYIVFVARKQWDKVREALRAADDKLIVEGYPVLEKRLEAITVYATNVTTKNLQAAKRAQQQSKE